MSDTTANAAGTAAKDATAKAAKAVARAQARRRELGFLAATLAVAGGVLTYLVIVADARLDPPTFALAVGAIALLYALRQMFFVVQALSRPPVEHLLDGVGDQPAGKETRLARFRVLRAIKQLDEDFALGKLEQVDRDVLRDGLVLQAVELNRRLAGERAAVHPALEKLLHADSPQRLVATGDLAEATDIKMVEPEAPTRELAVCRGCMQDNDADAKFCKNCGTTMPSAGDDQPAGEGASL